MPDKPLAPGDKVLADLHFPRGSDDLGWTLDFAFLGRVRGAVMDRCGEMPSEEAIEAVLLAAEAALNPATAAEPATSALADLVARWRKCAETREQVTYDVPCATAAKVYRRLAKELEAALRRAPVPAASYGPVLDFCDPRNYELVARHDASPPAQEPTP